MILQLVGGASMSRPITAAPLEQIRRMGGAFPNRRFAVGSTQQFLPLLRYICPHLAMGNPFEVRHICSAFTESVCPFLGIRVRTMPPY